MPRATSSTRPRVFSSTPTESASWRERPVARAETAAGEELRRGGDDEHDQDLAAVAEVEVAEVRGRAREDEVQREQERGRPRSRRGSATAASGGERRAREEDAEGERAEDVVQARLVRRERRGGEARPTTRIASHHGRRTAPCRRCRRSASRRARRARATRPTAAPASFATSSPLDELFAASASASAIQLSTSLTAAQLRASEPIRVPTGRGPPGSARAPGTR